MIMKKIYHTLAIAAIAAASMFSVQSANAKPDIDPEDIASTRRCEKAYNELPEGYDQDDIALRMKRYFFIALLEGFKDEQWSQDTMKYFLDKGKSLGFTAEELKMYFTHARPE